MLQTGDKNEVKHNVFVTFAQLIVFLQTSWPGLFINRPDISDEERTVVISRILSEHVVGHEDAGFLPISMHPGGFKIH